MSASDSNTAWPWSAQDPVEGRLLDILDLVEKWGDMAYLHVIARKQWAESFLRELDGKKGIKGSLLKPPFSEEKIQEALRSFESGLKQWIFEKSEAQSS